MAGTLIIDAIGIPKAAYWQTTDPAVANPTHMRTGIWWVDTSSTPKVLKRRNASNDGWDTEASLYTEAEFNAAVEALITASGGSYALTKRTANSADAAEDTDDIIIADTSGGDFQLDLMSLADRTGNRPLYVRCKGSGTLTVTPDGSETVDGGASFGLEDGDAVTFIPASSTDWGVW